jgi:hypothetical protein
MMVLVMFGWLSWMAYLRIEARNTKTYLKNN